MLPVKDVSRYKSVRGTEPRAELREKHVGTHGQQQGFLLNKSISTPATNTKTTLLNLPRSVWKNVYYKYCKGRVCLTLWVLAVKSISLVREHLALLLGHLGPCSLWLSLHRCSNSQEAALPQSWWGCDCAIVTWPLTLFSLPDDTVLGKSFFFLYCMTQDAK